MSGKRTEFDVIVVGSGPGGASVARELSLRSTKVMVLEWGNNKPINGTMVQTVGMGLIPGKSLLFTSQMLGVVRGITTGGSSVMAYATALDPPLAMLQSHGVDINHELKEAKKDLPYGLLNDELIGPAAKRIMESACSLGYDWQKLPKLIYQDKCRANCDKCTMGCPYDAKWNARNYLNDACQNGAHFMPGAKVEKVIKEGKKAVGVTYVSKGKEEKVYAEKIVLSAGGIGSPVVLRKSGIKNAGNNFFFDPLIVVMGTVKDIKVGRELPMAAGIRMESEGYLMTDIVWPKWVYEIFISQVFRLDRIFSHNCTLPIMIKIKDELGGSLSDSGGIRKTLGKKDKDKFNKGYARAKEILRNAGAGNIFKTWYLASHPGGTVKIDDLVDSNLKTEIENLYVCDCSVIPEELGTPPILTLVCLGKRLARHLLKVKSETQIIN